MDNNWVSCPKSNPQARLRLFCFPYAGATVTVFHSWSKLLPHEVELYLVHLPGRARRLREKPFVNLSFLVETLAKMLHPLMDIPFALFGHSMGALIAFELTRQLRRQYSCLPNHLFVSGRNAPQLPDRNPPLHHLPEKMFLRELEARYNGLPEAVTTSPELLALFLPIIRADLTLVETYAYATEKPLDCPISAYCGREDHTIEEDALIAWKDQTRSNFNYKMFDGDHFYLHSAKTHLVHSLARDLRHVLV